MRKQKKRMYGDYHVKQEGNDHRRGAKFEKRNTEQDSRPTAPLHFARQHSMQEPGFVLRHMLKTSGIRKLAPENVS